MNFITISQKELPTTYLNIREPHLLISVTSPNEGVSIPSTPYCKQVLKLKFDDVDDLDEKYVYFDMSMAKEIIDFVNNHINLVNTIIVQCEAGVSRSVAIASALSKIINNKDDEIFNTGIPNMLVYSTLLEGYYGTPDLKTRWNKLYYVRKDNLKEQLDPVLLRMLLYRIDKRDKDSKNE